MVRTITRIKLLILSILLSGVVFAYEGDIADIYQVEVIVFEHTEGKRYDAEKWPKTVGKLDTKNAIKLSTARQGAPESLDVLEALDALDEVGDQPLKKVVPETIGIVEPKNLRMQEEVRVLKNNKTSRVIQHIGWTQPLANYVKSTPVVIQGGKDGEEFQAVVDIKPIARNQFNVSFDMIFTTSTSNKQGIKEIRITRDVKVKSKEIYYFDHPVISAMILINPLVVDQ